MFNKSFFSSNSQTSELSVDSIRYAEHEYTVRHLIEEFTMYNELNAKGPLIDLQVSLDKLALHLIEEKKKRAQQAADILMYPSVEAAEIGLLKWSEEFVQQEVKKLDTILEQLSNISGTPLTKPSAEQKKSQELIMKLGTELGSKYKKCCRELANVQLGSGIINDALDLIQSKQKTIELG